MDRNWYVGEDARILEEAIARHRGKKNNVLNGLTFKQILELAKQGKV